MRVPLSWLRRYVALPPNAPEIAQALTMTGTKAETIEYPGKDIQGVVTGKIRHIQKHPSADKLVITQVDTDQESLQIITGASNIQVGDIVPVAVEGASLPGEKKISAGLLRGEKSQGMMCSLQELGFSEKVVPKESKDGIWILPFDTPVGEDICQAADLQEAIIEFELTSNRPDCLSMIGIAREAAAAFSSELSAISTNFQPTKQEIDWKVQNQVGTDCSAYLLREIAGVKIAPSPLWLQSALMQAGIRPINNIVDITNFIMIETGQPMHAFDADTLHGHEIFVRLAHPEEAIETLDEKVRTLPPGALIIADDQKALGIAGVMGAQSSQITPHTQRILLESACFDKEAIRQTSKALGLRTDASARFEKGLDPQRAALAMNRAVSLIEQVAQGKSTPAAGFIQESQMPTITLSCQSVRAMIGQDLSDQAMIQLLERLYLPVKYKAGQMTVTVPSYRLDLKEEADILEEIVRLYGFNNILAVPLQGEVGFSEKEPLDLFEENMRDACCSAGYSEILTYSFISEAEIEKIGLPTDQLIRIENPLGEETAVMRSSLLPKLLSVVSTNLSRSNEELRCFESGSVFSRQDQQVIESVRIAGAAYGKEESFYTMSAALSRIFDQLHVESIALEPDAKLPWLHPKRSAALVWEGQTIGTIGEVHPVLSEKMDFKKRVYLFDLDVARIRNAQNPFKLFQGVVRFPAIHRDIAFTVDQNIYVREIEKIIQSQADHLIEKISLFDIYQGDQVEEGKKSLAYSITFRSPHSTLRDEEVNQAMQRITQALVDQIQARIRQ